MKQSVGVRGPARLAWRSYLQLLRLPNLPTAAADVLAGYAVAGLPGTGALLWLLPAGLALYAGGVVLNDAHDAALDAVERPERPIPSGQIGRGRAFVLGYALLGIGVAAAFAAGSVSGRIAMLLAAAVLLYDAWSKQRPLWGALNMGACRGLNLLLGVSAAPALLGECWHLALLPLAYVAAVTAVSRGEVHGGRRATGALALGLLYAVLLGLLAMAWSPAVSGWALLPFLLLLMFRVLPPFWRAYLQPQPGPIRRAVQAGVLSLIVLDAAIAAGHGGLLYGLALLSLLPLSLLAARTFAVT